MLINAKRTRAWLTTLLKAAVTRLDGCVVREGGAPRPLLRPRRC
jgi:hypothetical protein